VEGRGWLVTTRITQQTRRLKSVAACESEAWTIASWKIKKPGRVHLRPFKCNSWRHEGECREKAGARDFVRCKEAMESKDSWVYAVLTFDPSEWKGEYQAYRGGGKLWNRLRTILCRKYGKLDYIQTWEATKKGWPHVNIVINNEQILKECEGDGWKKFRQDLKRMAVRAGFGKVLWVEPVRDPVEMAGYITKLSRELTGASRKDQVPVNAPRHFRRLRASRGLLPAKLSHAGVWTGQMIQRNVEEIRSIERTRGLDVEALANPGLWTVFSHCEERSVEVETHYEVEILENIILEKMVQETRAG
jgi:hypothetical protein